jgi:GAF domain-containing protein
MELRMVTRQDRLAHAFVELADSLVEDFDVVDLLARLGERCVELFDAVAAGLLLADGDGVLRLMAATSEAMEIVELFQLQNDQGPCLDCYQRGEPVQVEDLAAAGGQWPRFVAVATDAGFRSAHAFPLRLRGRVLGALNLFRSVPGHLAPGEVAAAQALADVATIAIIQHRAAHDAQDLADQLHLALNSRILIEQAKGVIAEHAGVGMDEAFARLRGYARRHRRLLGEVAREVIDREIPAGNLVA